MVTEATLDVGLPQDMRHDRMVGRPLYGRQFHRITFWNSDRFTSRDWDWVEHVKCRLAPGGILAYRYGRAPWEPTPW